MKFINRNQELRFLEKKFNSGQAELIILYGRRRIGKTELILRFCKGKKMLYFLGRLESKIDTIKRFNNSLIEVFDDKSLLKYALTNWDSIFDYLAEKIHERFIVVMDEFPFIIGKFPEIISILQDKWDSKLRNTKIMIILLGSSIGMMEKHTLNYQSPLYGRRTGQWRIDKLGVSYLRNFFPKYDIQDLIVLYSCLDSIPGYLVKLSPEKSIMENIKDYIFSKGEFLYEEIEILLREEFRDPSNYMSILSAISGGLQAFSEIYNQTGMDKSLLSKYLYTLDRLGIIEKKIPITRSYKAKLKAKGAHYHLKDNFFEFWFRFVYLNKQELEKGNVDLVMEFFKKEIDNYVGRKFEQFIMELIPKLNIGSFYNTGSWWFKDKEIDIVSLNEKNKEILFCECKWSDKVDALRVMKALNLKKEFVDWHKEDRKEIFAIFAKSFYKKINEFDGKRVYCFDLQDIDKICVSD
ncbi:MAG: ATP-binding protein [Candidatus Helarchaeota archaeon]